MTKILTGSKEFFSEGKDNDYLAIREQDEVFKHERIDGNCYFFYKPMTKAEYLEWLTEKNNWYLNTAPLITKEWLLHYGIDIFGEDKEVIYSIFKHLFNMVYRNIPVSYWNKYAYRLYIYTQYIENEGFELSPAQLEVAHRFKTKTMTDALMAKGIYRFFGAEEEPVFAI